MTQNQNELRNRSLRVCQLISDSSAENNVGEIRKLLAQGVDIDIQDVSRGDNTPLHLAARKSDKNCVQILLNHKPNLLIKNRLNETPLEAASCDEVRRLLLAASFDFVDKNAVQEIAFQDISKERLDILMKCSLVKVLKVAKCKSLHLAWEMLRRHEFMSAIAGSSHLFIIAFEIQGIDIDANSSMLSMPFAIQRPMIVQIISVRINQTAIYFKEENSTLLKKIEPNIRIDEDEFMEKIHSEDDCNFALLVQGLQSNIFGTLNGSLLDSKMDNDTRRSTIVNYFARTNALCHRFFRLFHENLTEKELNDRVLATLRFKGDQSLLALLDLPFMLEYGDDIKMTDDQNRILGVENSRKYSLPMIAVEFNNVKALNMLICCGADLSHCGADKKFASDICWDDENWECLAQLIEAGSPYPENFDVSLESLATSSFVGKINASIKASLAFHVNVKLGNLSEIKTFVDNNCKLKQVYGSSNKSALTVALESHQTEIYSLLLSKGFAPGADTGYDEVFKNFIAKNEIRNMHRKYFRKAFDEPHLKRLLDKCRLSFGSLNRDNCSRIIQEMFLKLNEIPEIVPILKIVSTSEHLKIVFDFNSRSVVSMDPTADSLTDGRTYHNDGFLYVGAEDHLEGFFNVMGTLAHELCHYAMQLTYINNSKPYACDDQISEKAFEEVTLETQQFCLDNPMTDSIISDVFKYPVNLWLRELIVRVPHLLARYKIETNTLRSIKRQNFRLFDFFSTKVLSDVELRSLILTQQIEINKINRKTGTISKIKKFEICFEKLQAIGFEDQIITSIAPQFTLAMLIQFLESSSTIFIGIEQIVNGGETAERINKLSYQFTVVVDCFESVEKYSETICKIREFVKESGALILVMAENESLIAKEKGSNFKVTSLVHKWSDLTNDLQESLLLKRVIFQGAPMRLNDLMNASSEALQQIPLNQFLNSDAIHIGVILPSPLNKFHVARSFITRMHKPNKRVRTTIICKMSRGQYRSFARREKFRSGAEAARRKRESDKFITSVMTLKDLLIYAEQSTAVIISDSAGSGKTHTLHEVARTLKEKDQLRWTLFVDLKQHTEILKTCKTAAKIKTFDVFVTRNILTNTSDFEKKLFSQLHKEGRTNILLDGFDEISPYFKKEVLEALKLFVTESGNQLWITTRTYLIDELEDALSQLSCSLQPLSKEVQIDFLRDSWQASANRNEPNSSEDFSAIAESLISRLSSISQSLSTLIGSPILICMIAEIYDDSLKRKSLMQPETLSSYFIYEQFIKRNIRNWMTKGKAYEIEQQEINLQSEGILVVHQKIALAHCINNLEADYDGQDWNVEKLSRLGLLQYENSKENLSFVHETFAEYFVTNFIVQNLKPKPKLCGVLEILVKVLCEKKFQIVRLFLNQALREMKFQPDFYKTAGLHLNRIVKEGNTTLSEESVLLQERKKSEMLLNISNEACENLFIFTLEVVCHMEEEMLKKVLLAKKKAGDNVLHNILQNTKNDTVQALLDVIGRLKLVDRVAIMQTRGSKQRNIFHCASLNQNFQIFKILINFAAKILTNDKVKNMLKEKDEVGWNVLHYAATSTDLIEFLRKLLSVEELKDLIVEADQQGLRETEKLGPTSTGTRMLGAPIVGESSWILKSKTRNRGDKSEESLLHIAVFQSNKMMLISHFKVVEEILGAEEIKKLLRQPGYERRNILHNSCYNKNEDIISTTLEEITKLGLTKDDIIEMLKEKDSDGLNVFHVAANRNALIDLLGALKTSEININEVLFETDSDGYSFLHLALMRYTKEAIKSLFEYFGDSLNQEETKKLLQQNASQERNIFRIVSGNRNKEMFSTLFECASKILPREEIKQMLCSNGKHISYLLDITNWDATLDDENTFKNVLKILGDLFPAGDIKFVFQIVGQNGESALHFYVLNKDKRRILAMFAVCENLLSVEEIKQLLRRRESDGLNLLHLASCNDKKDVFSTVLEITQKLLPKDDIKEMILERSRQGKNLLHYVGCFRLGFRGEDISNASQAVLFRAMESFLSNTEIRDLISQSTDHGSNCLLFAAEKRNEKFIETLFDFSKRFLNLEQQRALFQKFDSDGDNIFTCAVLNSSKNVFSTFLKYAREIFSDLEIKILIQNSGRDRSVILNLARNPDSKKVVHELFDNLKKVLNNDELKTLVSYQDGSMSNIFHLFAAKNRYSYENYILLKPFLLLLKNDLKLAVSDIKDLLTSRNNDNKTAMHLAYEKRVQNCWWAILKDIFDFDDLVDLLRTVSPVAPESTLEMKSILNKLSPLKPPVRNTQTYFRKSK